MATADTTAMDIATPYAQTVVHKGQLDREMHVSRDAQAVLTSGMPTKVRYSSLVIMSRPKLPAIPATSDHCSALLAIMSSRCDGVLHAHTDMQAHQQGERRYMCAGQTGSAEREDRVPIDLPDQPCDAREAVISLAILTP